MKKMIQIVDDGFLAEECKFFKNKNNNDPIDIDRNIYIGSGTCVLDCVYLKIYDKLGKYIVCEKLNMLDRINKLKTL
ncbi:hypothetical protein M0Q50_07950 [bacterium]|jgi:hypothetical protein|nr:hypothetical protein [bacterium]